MREQLNYNGVPPATAGTVTGKGVSKLPPIQETCDTHRLIIHDFFSYFNRVLCELLGGMETFFR